MTSIIVILISVFFMNMENNVEPPVFETTAIEVVTLPAEGESIQIWGNQEALKLKCWWNTCSVWGYVYDVCEPGPEPIILPKECECWSALCPG